MTGHTGPACHKAGGALPFPTTMSINRTVVQSWVATVTLHNGQILEMEVRGRTIKECRTELKRDTQVKSVEKLRKGGL